jgi:hypothetical protein
VDIKTNNKSKELMSFNEKLSNIDECFSLLLNRLQIMDRYVFFIFVLNCVVRIVARRRPSMKRMVVPRQHRYTVPETTSSTAATTTNGGEEKFLKEKIIKY